MPGDRPLEPEYVASRRVLLDAFEALGAHRAAVVLVGAQAIYLHIGEGDLAVAPHTTDGDLVLDPRKLADRPNLVAALEGAGFSLAVRPGSWIRTAVQIDFMVPALLGGPGRRGARLGAHGSDFARKTSGLEASVVDYTTVRIAALDPGDHRAFEVAVASLAALLVAKLHKIAERKDDSTRRQDKDGLDVLRVLRFADTRNLAARLGALSGHAVAGGVTRMARTFLLEYFANRQALGTQMAVRASAGLEDPQTIAASCEVLAKMLLSEWR